MESFINGPTGAPAAALGALLGLMVMTLGAGPGGEVIVESMDEAALAQIVDLVAKDLDT